MIMLNDNELRTELDFNRKPLDQLKETTTEWLLGTWTLSKSHRTWRVGYAHPLVPGAHVRAFKFNIDDQHGVAVFFESADEPPWIFVGWVPVERRREADAWVAFLNGEIAKRLADQSSCDDGSPDIHDGSTAQDIEDELAERRFTNSLGTKPYKRP